MISMLDSFNRGESIEVGSEVADRIATKYKISQIELVYTMLRMIKLIAKFARMAKSGDY